MAIFKNKHFVKRDYETSNIVYAVAPAVPNENYVATTDAIPATMRMIYSQAGVEFWGFL